ncbi:MAG: hypothetical protein K0R59_145 [Sphingobacterium sp.]|jgi:hypothetical protein|nr:hypothetical protein [Sphingobacterium sp.]
MAATTTGTAFTGPYKVAYYAFDNGGPRISEFAPDANVVVLFEGSVWAMADTLRYPFSDNYIKANTNYKSYKALLADVRTLQSRGVKVLYNVDDDVTWQNAITLPTGNRGYKGKDLSATEYANLIKVSTIDSLHLDGIALDQEHIIPWGTAPNQNYLNVLNALSSHFGLTSANPSTIFTTASGANVRYCLEPLQNNTAYAANMNFVMDQGYGITNADRIQRLLPFASIANFGWPKTVAGISAALPHAEDIITAQWQPTDGSYKGGIFIYAANSNPSYTAKIFKALSPIWGTGGSTGSSGVTFYQNGNYGGTASKSIPKGNYTISNFAAYGVVNDWASSVKIPAGWKVTLYEDANFTGTSWTLTADNSWLGALSPSANDKVSSFKIQ